MNTADRPVATDSALLVRDFPAWFPSMLAKELRQGLRTRGFVGTLVIFQLVMAIAMLPTAIPDALGGATVSTSFFWTVVAVQLLLVGPSRALGGLQQEADSRTLDLLLLTQLDAWGIVLGKWLSLLAQSALLMVAVLPYAIVRWFAGSIDLVAEAQSGGLLFVLSAILTAGGLWASRVAKVLRVVLVIVLLFFAQVLGSVFATMFGIRLGASAAVLTPTGWSAAGVGWLLLCDAIIVTGFLLLSAARNIAPPAVNHAPLGRLLALTVFLPVPLLLVLGNADLARTQLSFAGGFLLLVCGVELAVAAPVMARHWRPWVCRGRLGRIAGVYLLPGWESALWFAVVGAAVWTGCGSLFPAVAASALPYSAQLAWTALMGLAALAFPAVLISFGGHLRFSRAGAYLGLLGLMGAIIGVLVAWSSVAPKWAFFRAWAEVLPVGSFIFSFFLSNADPATFVLQGVFGLGVLGAAFLQTRLLAAQLALFTAQEEKQTRAELAARKAAP